MKAQEIANFFNNYRESGGSAIGIGQSGNALYQARVTCDALEFRDGFGKWRIIHRDTLAQVLDALGVRTWCE